MYRLRLHLPSAFCFLFWVVDSGITDSLWYVLRPSYQTANDQKNLF